MSDHPKNPGKSPDISSEDVEETKAPKAPPLAVRFEKLARAMRGERNVPPWPLFGNPFHLLRSENGELRCLSQEANMQVTDVGLGPVRDAITKFCWRELKHASFKHYDLTPNNVAQAALHWKSSTTPLASEPKMVAFRSDSSLCFHKLSFDPDPNMPTPIFDEIISRCTEPEALRAYIGSIFNQDANCEQYLWMYGSGMNGKGSILNLISRLLGRAYAAEEPESIMDANNRFWTWGLRGKRVIAFAECGKPKMVECARFKSLTGGDAIRVEEKKGTISMELMQLKIIIGSNEKPDISSIRADTRRILFVSFAELSKTVRLDGQYRNKLWAEAPGIVAKCIEDYNKLCPDHGEIPCSQEAIDAVVAENEEDFEDLFDMCFVLEKDAEVPGSDFKRQVTEIGNTKNNHVIKKFKQWLERTHGIKRTGQHPRVYPGIRRKG